MKDLFERDEERSREMEESVCREVTGQWRLNGGHVEELLTRSYDAPSNVDALGRRPSRPVPGLGLEGKIIVPATPADGENPAQGNRLVEKTYDNVNACDNANEMWIAIERLMQGKPINKHDVRLSCFGNLGSLLQEMGKH
ncbi:hypothetical protein Tco_1523829 [Tanacetum coccineum]